MKPLAILLGVTLSLLTSTSAIAEKNPCGKGGFFKRDFCFYQTKVTTKTPDGEVQEQYFTSVRKNGKLLLAKSIGRLVFVTPVQIHLRFYVYDEREGRGHQTHYYVLDEKKMKFVLQ